MSKSVGRERETMTIPSQRHHIMSSFDYTLDNRRHTFPRLLCSFHSHAACNQKQEKTTKDERRNNNLDTLSKWILVMRQLLTTLSTVRSGLFIIDRLPGGNGWLYITCFVHFRFFWFCFCHWWNEMKCFHADSMLSTVASVEFELYIIWIFVNFDGLKMDYPTDLNRHIDISFYIKLFSWTQCILKDMFYFND